MTIKNLQKRIQIRPRQIKQTADRILRLEGVSSADLSIVFVTNQKIKSLNKTYLQRDHATDVLAFDLVGKGSIPLRNKKAMSIAGEIFISVDAACKNAPLYNMTVQRELVLYLIHGILHLLGYDDHGPKQIKRMRQREEQILRAIVPKKK